MKRTDYVLLWKPKSGTPVLYPDGFEIICNRDMCDTIRADDGRRIYDCPFGWTLSACHVMTHPTVYYNNQTDILIATIQKCNGKQYGCQRQSCINCSIYTLINKHNKEVTENR